MPDHADPGGAASQPSEAADSSEDSQATATSADSAGAQMQAWLALGGHALAVIEQFATVVTLELGLAIADAKRLLLVLLAMIPVLLFTWLGLCVLLAWLAFAVSHSVALGLVAFLLLQLGSLYLLGRAAIRLQSSLGLPVSRRQWRVLMKNLAAGSDGPVQDP